LQHEQPQAIDAEIVVRALRAVFVACEEQFCIGGRW
jgi:hypothetical protein